VLRPSAPSIDGIVHCFTCGTPQSHSVVRARPHRTERLPLRRPLVKSGGYLAQAAPPESSPGCLPYVRCRWASGAVLVVTLQRDDVTEDVDLGDLGGVDDAHERDPPTRTPLSGL
jgi:hypothetical protein